MRISIGVPGVSVNFDEGQIKLFLKEKTNELFNQHVIPLVIQATCKALEVVANNTADAHDYLIGKLKTKKSA
jgi:hypothetical protein